MCDLPKIKIFGVGGAGCEILSKLRQKQYKSVEYYAVDDDYGRLQQTQCENKIPLRSGDRAGGDYAYSEKTAADSKDMFLNAVKGADMVILTAGMGGGTGSAVTPAIAGIAKAQGILTVGVVCSPFGFEGDKRINNAARGINILKENTDATFVFPCEGIKSAVAADTSVAEVMRIADAMIESAIDTIVSPLTAPSVINLDYGEMLAALKNSDKAYFGIGVGKGKDRAADAVKGAADCPFSGDTLGGVNRVILYVQARDNLTTDEITAIGTYVWSVCGESAEIHLAIRYDCNLEEETIVSVFATSRREAVNAVADIAFSTELKKVLKSAEKVAAEYDSPYITTDYIVYAMLVTDCLAGQVLKTCGVDVDGYRGYMARDTDPEPDVTQIPPKTQDIIDRAKRSAIENDGKDAEAGTEHLLLAVTQCPDCFAMQILHVLGADTEKINKTLGTVLSIQ